MRYFVIILLIIGCIGHFFGDRIAYLQANVMVECQYYVSAYKFCGKIIRNYPESPYLEKAKTMREKLKKDDPDTAAYAKEESEQWARDLVKQEKEKALKSVPTP
jgi:hypothetical protein